VTIPPFLRAGDVAEESSVQGYGLSETNAYVCSTAGGDYLAKVSRSTEVSLNAASVL
jgi:hypothetical protein